MTNIYIGEKIRELRKKKGITQEQLASALGLSSQAVSKWEMNTSYPDITLLPVIAGYFGVSMDLLFNYDADKVAENIQETLYRSRVNAHDFESKEKILLEGIAAYPGGEILKRELLELYAGQIRAHGRNDLTEKALEIGKELCEESGDSFIYLGVMGDMADIYIQSGRYAKAKELIESMPYRYHLDIYDRMRCSVMFLTPEDSLHEARDWKRWAHQELHMVAEAEGTGFFAVGDYENAYLSFMEAADVIERFWQREIPREYSLLQGPASQGASMIKAAACLYQLGRTDECDAALDKSYLALRSCFDEEGWKANGQRYLDQYKDAYNKMGLDAYKPFAYC